jgi:membrane associated rhomboid family serine protease
MLIGINVAVYFLMLLLNLTGQHEGIKAIENTFWLMPADVVHGRIWEIFSYSFLHDGFFHIFFNMLTLWMFGATLEQYWGRRQFLEFYFFAVFGAAICTVIIAYAANGVLGRPDIPTVGASGGICGLLLAFGYLFRDQEIFLIFPPISMKAKYFVGILIIIDIVGAMGGLGGNVAYVGHLGGSLFGFLYLKFLPRRGLSLGLSESYYGIRNSYHKWKRRRAARKFQVYMRKHQHDPKQYFDEYGNFKPPDDGDKKDHGGWVN